MLAGWAQWFGMLPSTGRVQLLVPYLDGHFRSFAVQFARSLKIQPRFCNYRLISIIVDNIT